MIENQKGSIIVISLITIAVLMILGAYFLNSVISEIKIAKSMENAITAYYLAESGLNEAIWKLNNDDYWRESFISESLNPDINGNYWSDSFTREGIGGGSYTVTIQNNGRASGEIISVAEVLFLGKIAKRKVKTVVFRGLESPTKDAGIFSAGHGSNIGINHSHLVIYNGNLFSNHNLIISGNSTLSVYDDLDTEKLEGKVLSTHNINLSGNAQILESSAICSRNLCTEDCDECPAEETESPMVDFESDDDKSFKKRAEANENNFECEVVCDPENSQDYLCSEKCIFSSNEFEDLLWEVGKNGSLILNNQITYVEGHVDLRGGRVLEVNGILVADGNIEIGEKYSWVRRGQKDDGFSHILVNRPSLNMPTGLISKKKVSFGDFSLKEESFIEGIIYAGDEIKMTSIPEKLNIIGGLISRQSHFVSLWNGLEITLDNEIIMWGLGYIINEENVNPYFSPIVQVGHWEEVF